MPDKKLKLGLIGAGAIAQSYVRVLAEMRDLTVVAVTDVRPEAARAMAETFGCDSYGSHEQMAADKKLDIVVICTPPSTHRDLCLFFLSRKIHVLCEKPLTIDVPSAARVLEAARSAGVTFAMASKFRYVEDVIRAKSILASGILGDLLLFENSFTSRVDMSNRWNSDPTVSGGGVLIDNGTHSLDIMRYLLGPLAEVQAVEGKRSRGLGVEEMVHLSVRSESGVTCSIDLSWSFQKETESYICLYGSHGTVVVGWAQSKYRQTTSRDWVVFGKGYDKNQALRSQMQNFVNAVQGKEKLLITPEDAFASVQLVEASYRSLREGNWTRFDSPAGMSAASAVAASGSAAAATATAGAAA